MRFEGSRDDDRGACRRDDERGAPGCTLDIPTSMLRCWVRGLMPGKDSASRVGAIIASKYKLLRVLGEGGMGAVYEAEHTVTRRHVAVKLMHTSLGWTDQSVQRFLQEAQVAAAIGHPNIIDVLDAGLDEAKAPYVVFEYLKGESAASVLDRKGKLPVADALSITGEVLSGLAAAHDRGIVHRDIKPDNVFLYAKPKGQFGVKLLDFGISKITSEGADGGLERQRLTSTGAVMGTVNYMSPEQVRGDADIDARADVWSVGVMLYELVSGRLPFEGNRVHAVMLKIINDGTIETLTDLPASVWAVIERALARDRDARFADARAMLAALSSDQDAVADPLGQTLTSTPPAPSFVIETLPPYVPAAPQAVSASTLEPHESARIPRANGLFSRRSPTRLAAAAALAALLGGGLWFVTRPAPPAARPAAAVAPTAPPLPTPPREESPAAPVLVAAAPAVSPAAAPPVAPPAASTVTPPRRRVRRPARGPVAPTAAPSDAARAHDYGSRIVHDPNWGN